jgi:hypothetical protein
VFCSVSMMSVVWTPAFASTASFEAESSRIRNADLDAGVLLVELRGENLQIVLMAGEKDELASFLHPRRTARP